jgi:hypothetical protein
MDAMLTDKPRFVHLHIPKTAGTALRQAMERLLGRNFRVAPHLHEGNVEEYYGTDHALFSGHFGFPAARRLGGDIITMLRHPVDRLVSLHAFWRQCHKEGTEVSQKTRLAARYSFEEFLCIDDDPYIVEELLNRMTWQLSHGGLLFQRTEARMAGVDEDQLIETALRNLADCRVVGIQEDMASFCEELGEVLGIQIDVPQANVTGERPALADLSARALRLASRWTYLDTELYHRVCRARLGRRIPMPAANAAWMHMPVPAARPPVALVA